MLKTKRNILYILLVVLSIQGCTSYQYQFVSQESIEDTKSSTYDRVLLTSGIWLEQMPLMVNSEFDFGMAMSIEGVGPAIAAGMRLNKNKQAAELLKSMPTIDLHAALSRQFKSAGVTFDDESQIAIYGLLFGNPQAHLQTIVEIYSLDRSLPPQRYVIVSSETDIETWASDDGALMTAKFKAALPQIVDLIALSKTTPWESTIAEEDVIRARKFKGKQILNNSDKQIIMASNMPTTLIQFQPVGIK